jgi:hypothetical protein
LVACKCGVLGALFFLGLTSLRCVNRTRGIHEIRALGLIPATSFAAPWRNSKGWVKRAFAWHQSPKRTHAPALGPFYVSRGIRRLPPGGIPSYHEVWLRLARSFGLGKLAG